MRIFLVIFVLFSATSWATEDVIEFDSKQQEELYRVLVKELRCPKCQNQNIADSNAVVAKDMRVKTIDLVKQGKNKEEVVNYMVDRYGQFAHYKPPVNTATSMLWVLPIGFILLALLLLAKRSRQPQSSARPEAPDSSIEEDDELKDLLAKVEQQKVHK